MFEECYAAAAIDSDAAGAPVMFEECYAAAAIDSDAAGAPVMFEECYAAAAGDSDADPVAATDVDSAWSHADTLLLIETYRQFRGQRDGCVQQTVRTP